MSRPGSENTMTYGKEIGRKFYEDGRVRRYPGNTVVAAIPSGCAAFDVMTQLHHMVLDAGFATHLIPLPHDSYHMTVIRGLNDQVRTDAFWPEKLPKDAPMTVVDDYVSAAVGSVKMPTTMRMKFDKIRFSATCMIVLLKPADEEQDRMLRAYRDEVAERIGLFLPKHGEYKFHISLAYTRILPEGEDEVRMQALIEQMNSYIADRPAFDVTDPYMAFYDDMLRFSPTRVPRD